MAGEAGPGANQNEVGLRQKRPVALTAEEGCVNIVVFLGKDVEDNPVQVVPGCLQPSGMVRTAICVCRDFLGNRNSPVEMQQKASTLMFWCCAAKSRQAV